MRAASVCLFTIVVGLAPALAEAQSICTLEPKRAFRGEQVRLRLPAGTTAKVARVTLHPMSNGSSRAGGESQTATEYGQNGPDLPVAAEAAAFAVDSAAPLGRYTVAVALDGVPGLTCGTLQVALPDKWSLELSEFSPSGTFDVPLQKVIRNGETSEVKTVSVSLRGTGFLADVPEDNRIFINGVRRPVVWDGCPAPATAGDAPPTDLPTHGEVLNSGQIDLCQIEVPDRHRVITFEVAQEGVSRTVVRYFRLYWWDRKMVGTVAIGVALLLAGVVLLFIRSFKRSQSTETPLGVLQILFLDPETDTYSLSKLQFYLWTFAAVFGYVYLAISRLFIQGERWPDIPEGLPAVIALGAGTAVGAQIVQNTKGPKGAGSERPSLGDFVTSGGVAAPERVQMLVWTFVGVAVFMYTVLQHGPEEIQALDPVPAGLLYMMGLSSLGYLGGKLARAAGPIINEISIVPADSDQTLQDENPPPLPDLGAARSSAEQTAARLAAAGGAAAKPALDALSAGIAALKQSTTLAALRALVTTLTGEVAKAEAAAAAAAAAATQANPPPDAGTAAQTAQGAAAAAQDLLAAVTTAVSDVPTTTPRREVTRVIELRGRNLSDQALLSIDQAELPFRMLRPNQDGKQQPEVVIREKSDPNLAVVLRLTIDPARLEAPDLRQYRVWFGAPSTKARTFSIMNLDGQRAEIAFSVPPSTAQKPTDTVRPDK